MERQRGGAQKGQSEQGGIVQPPYCVGLTVCITARYTSLLPKALLICCLLAPLASSGKEGGSGKREGERFSFAFSIFKLKSFLPRKCRPHLFRLQHGVIEKCWTIRPIIYMTEYICAFILRTIKCNSDYLTWYVGSLLICLSCLIAIMLVHDPILLDK